MSRTQELPLLTLEGTNLLLLEMPFSPWSSRMVEEVLEIQERRGLQVLLAHVERYLPYQEPKVWERLRQGKVWMQCNASFFLHWRTKPKALRMLRKGEIHMLGSDCHNKTTRPPRLGEAAEVIEKSLGQGTWPVSYTHLDVYKRQASRSAPRPAARRTARPGRRIR